MLKPPDQQSSPDGRLAQDRSAGGPDRAAAPGTPAAQDARSRPARVLIVEDEYLVACLLEEDLLSQGYELVGPCTTLASALDASRREPFDLAVLDINLNGEMSYPLAEELVARGVPLLFLTGYTAGNLPEPLRALPRVSKPYDPAVLAREIRRLLATR
ncbi:MAG: response regulator [Pseudorhodoplanes sp.]|nr:response regulator [Pseudorhodoplanes sp.]